MNDKLRQLVRETIKAYLEEISTSAGAGGYQTPNAFGVPGDKNMVRKKLSWTKDLTPVEDKIDEARSRYDLFKEDSTATPTQKIGKAISEIYRNLQEMDRIVEMNERLKKESNVNSSGMWKRTHKHLTRIESKLLRMSQRIKELKS